MLTRTRRLCIALLHYGIVVHHDENLHVKKIILLTITRRRVQIALLHYENIVHRDGNLRVVIIMIGIIHFAEIR